jgi:hypothetical protein
MASAVRIAAMLGLYNLLQESRVAISFFGKLLLPEYFRFFAEHIRKKPACRYPHST